MLISKKKAKCVFSLFKAKSAFCLAVLVLFFSTLPVFSENYENTENYENYDSSFYLKKAETLIKKAEEQKLYEDSYWKTLLHYKPALFYRNKSLVDDPNFFCAKNGKTNPKAELNATIMAFFEPAPELFKQTELSANLQTKNQEKTSKTKQKEIQKHAIERFPGRYKWICEKFGLSETDFPYNGDAKYKKNFEKLNPGNVYLVFPSSYLKRAGSIFGHTFLLIETKNKPRLTANSINYGAVTNGAGGPLYAILGLFGGFKGYYGFETYYEKIKQYSDMDMRDMWEYKLNFSDEEKDKMLRHFFDLAGIYSKYFFISENCSYNLLFLLEAARPSTKATEKLFGIVEPLATVKLAYQLGLTEETKYRPSVYSKIEMEKQSLTLKEQRYVKAVCKGKKTTKDFPFEKISPEKQAKIWDTASDYLTYLLTSRKISSEDYRKRFVSILSARSKIKEIKTEPEKIPKVPEKSHGSKKIALTGGKDVNGNFCGMNFRVCAHEQLETPAGYSENSEISILNTEVRFSFEKNEFYLEKATLISLLSLPASDTFFFNKASHFLTGLEQNSGKEEEQDLAWRLKFLYGTSLKPFNWLQFYILGGADSYFSSEYKYGTDLLLGAETGFIATYKTWKTKFFASAMQSPFELEHLRCQFSADSCVFLSQNVALKGNYSFNMDYGNFRHDWSVSVNAYF